MRSTAILLVLAGIFSATATVARGQDIAPYSTGALIETPEQLASFTAAPTRRAFFPPVVDLTDRFPRPGDQGRQGSCVGWAVGYAARSYYRSVDLAVARLSNDQIASPSYVYNSIAGGCCHCGSFVSHALNLLRDDGVASLASYPYSDRVCSAPTAQQIASDFKIDDWLALRVSGSPSAERDRDIARLNLVKQELAFGHPVIIGVETTTTFFDGRGTWDGGGSTLCNGEPCGGHAMVIVGYNDEERRFKFINSWGTNWGAGGFGWMSYEAYLARVSAAYVMRLPFEPGPPEPLPTPTPEEFNITIPDLDCGGIVIEREGRGFRLTGFVGKLEDLEAMRRAVANRPDLTIDIEHRPWPQCETLMTLQNVLADERKPIIQFDRDTFDAGDTLTFDVQMADYQGYLHVAYIQADGNVVNLVQSSPLTLQTLSPQTQLTFGDGLQGRPRFTVSEPFGQEMLVVIASKSPLFESRRPTVEIERDFLSALRDAIIARPDTNSPERLVTADYYILETQGG